MALAEVKEVAEHMAEKHGESGGSWIIHHILDSDTFFGLFPLPNYLTNHVMFMLIASILLIFALSRAASSYKKSFVPTGFTNLIEIFIVFIRDEVVKPTIGKGYEKFLPFLLTVFFFILTINFLGLIPNGSTATGNIAVTSGLALISFFMTQAAGIKKNGFLGYFKGLIPHGIPAFVLPVMIVVEVLGLLTKPFALAIRLFANMTAGHVIILSLIGLIFILKTVLVSPVSVGFALFIYFLEILVAFIQAYIFTILSSLFIGMAVHQEH